MNALTSIKKINPEYRAGWILFLLLWTYLIIRSHTVFHIHDEIVTKWAYMVDWNFLPYRGYVDANNHFLNSFLGGLFVRIFNSEAIWVVRLPNILAFPLYFWSLFGLKRFFHKKINFFLFLILLCCFPFILEFFALARGYGISLALMAFALLQTALFFDKGKPKHMGGAVTGWVFAVCANLTLIPLALAGFAYLAGYTINTPKKKRKWWLLIFIPALVPVIYLIRYALHLKDIGKLYLGGKEGFFDITLHSLTESLWDYTSSYLDLFLSLLCLFIAFSALSAFLQRKDLFRPRLIFPVLMLISLLNIFGQNILLDVNFPEDRAALYLAFFFLAALAFAIDHWKAKWAAYPFIAFTAGFFITNFNFEKSHFWYYEHFDEELLTKIPGEVEGIPPSTGGRFWLMDNELGRTLKEPFRVFQEADAPSDTLPDYIISTKKIRPDLPGHYHVIHKDSISGLSLFERDKFLPRKKVHENELRLSGSTDEFINLFEDTLGSPCYFRVFGTLEEMNIFKDVVIVFSSDNIRTDENNVYEGYSFVRNIPVDKKGRIGFDFTFAMHQYSAHERVLVYLWNRRHIPLKGELLLEAYRIEN